MESRINNKVDQYVSQFKKNVCSTINSLESYSPDKIRNLVQYIYEYEQLVLIPEDFTKRKRMSNAIHLADRCTAKRANGEQCTRRRKKNLSYCGTHSKNTPHGIIEGKIVSEQEQSSMKTVEIWTQDINGIIYYIDDKHNVYDPKDILKNIKNPRVISQWSKDVDKEDVYKINEFKEINK